MAAPEIQPPRARRAGWIQRYWEEWQARHEARRTVDTDPPEMGSAEVKAFLAYLAVEGKVSASTQTRRCQRACCAIGNCWSGIWIWRRVGAL